MRNRVSTNALSRSSPLVIASTVQRRHLSRRQFRQFNFPRFRCSTRFGLRRHFLARAFSSTHRQRAVKIVGRLCQAPDQKALHRNALQIIALFHAASRNREHRNHFTTLKNPFLKILNEKISDHDARDALPGKHCERARSGFCFTQPCTIRITNTWYGDG